LKETRSLRPPQRGLGSLEPNLGKTNHYVIRFISWLICFPLSPRLEFNSNANPGLWFVVLSYKFQVTPIHPPSRRLSAPNQDAPAPGISLRRARECECLPSPRLTVATQYHQQLHSICRLLSHNGPWLSNILVLYSSSSR
jgi:hypothetical protein